jgi:hypothetical protein
VEIEWHSNFDLRKQHIVKPKKMTISHRLKIFTWHIHGTYLYYLSKGDFDIYIPVKKEKNEGYHGRGETFPFGANVIEVPAEHVRELNFDCILFQTNKNYLSDQFEILSEQQRLLPKIYLEHDPPADHPTDTPHIVQDTDIILVHVTHYNRLMWNNTITETRVIEHGVPTSPAIYSGEIEKGIVVINNLHQRGRKLGADIFKEVSRHVPLDLIGMGTLEFGGLGEILHPDLPQFTSQYRFFFNPIRYTSMGLAVCEAMACGIPVVALATTENASVFTNEYNGFMHTDIDYLIDKMLMLLQDKNTAREVGARGRALAEEKFSMDRFTRQWKETFLTAIVNTPYYDEKNSFY